MTSAPVVCVRRAGGGLHRDDAAMRTPPADEDIPGRRGRSWTAPRTDGQRDASEYLVARARTRHRRSAHAGRPCRHETTAPSRIHGALYDLCSSALPLWHVRRCLPRRPRRVSRLRPPEQRDAPVGHLGHGIPLHCHSRPAAAGDGRRLCQAAQGSRLCRTETRDAPRRTGHRPSRPTTRLACRASRSLLLATRMPCYVTFRRRPCGPKAFIEDAVRGRSVLRHVTNDSRRVVRPGAVARFAARGQ